MVQELLKRLERIVDIDVTRINRAQPDGRGILMDAEVRIVYPGGNEDRIRLVTATLGGMAVVGYSIQRDVIDISGTLCPRYCCIHPDTDVIDAEIVD